MTADKVAERRIYTFFHLSSQEKKIYTCAQKLVARYGNDSVYRSLVEISEQAIKNPYDKTILVRLRELVEKEEHLLAGFSA